MLALVDSRQLLDPDKHAAADAAAAAGAVVPVADLIDRSKGRHIGEIVHKITLGPVVMLDRIGLARIAVPVVIFLVNILISISLGLRISGRINSTQIFKIICRVAGGCALGKVYR